MYATTLGALDNLVTLENKKELLKKFRAKHEKLIAESHIVDYLVINNYLAMAAEEYKSYVSIPKKWAAAYGE